MSFKEMQSEQKLGFGKVLFFVFQSTLFILCPPQIRLFCATLGIRKLLQGWLAGLCSAAPHPQSLKRDAAMGSSLLLLHTSFNIYVPLQLQACSSPFSYKGPLGTGDPLAREGAGSEHCNMNPVLVSCL